MTPPDTVSPEKASVLFAEALRERRSFEELRAHLKNHAPAADSAKGLWYSALARSSSGVQAEFENWALVQAYAAGMRGIDFLETLYRSHLFLDDQESAAAVEWPLFRSLVDAGRNPQALAILESHLDREFNPVMASGLESEIARLGALAAWAEREAASRWRAVRLSLRKQLLNLLNGDTTRQDYNLVVFDYTGMAAGEANPKPALAAALLEAVSKPNPGLRESLADTADLKILWQDSADSFLVDAKGARRIAGGGSIAALAALCAHCRLAAPDSTGVVQAFAGTTDSNDSDSLVAREGYALVNLGIVQSLLVEAFGMRDMLQPDLVESIRRLKLAAESYVRTGRNFDPDYGLLVHFYCRSNGLATAWLSFLLRLYNPPYPAPSAPAILATSGSDSLPHIVETLHREGVYVFKQRLPDDLVDELVAIARTTPCYRHHETGKERTTTIYAPGENAAPKYDFLERDLVAFPAVQRLMAEPALFAVSQAYLGVTPTLSAVSMWWSTVFSRTPSSEAAQKWHFDLDHLHWLKWFVYLDDVDEGAGPHCFIPGTHRIGRKPPELLQRGYARIEDEEMARCFPPDRIRQFTGPKGTLFVEDTSGFHKGRMPETKPRLLLELEFCNSLFGSCFARDAHPGTPAIRELAAMARAYPHAYRKFPFLRCAP